MHPDIRHSILSTIAENGSNVSARLAEKHKVTRQTTSTWLSALKAEGIITSSGRGKGTEYHLVIQDVLRKDYIREGLQEDKVWLEVIYPRLCDLPENVRDIWNYAVTEMINNAIDHSGSETVRVELVRDALNTRIYVSDEGEGIFRKIQRALDLYDPREAILELAKGKLTTDPANHSGEGIFFSSKVMDAFDIRSGNLHFMQSEWGEDLLLERSSDERGTLVSMRLDNVCERTLPEIFNQFAAPEEYTFAKTIVPVRLAQYEGEKLVSRSQAKRLTKRFERFQTVVLDFSGVEGIGQAFADEVFRVFRTAHPSTQLLTANSTVSVDNMIKRATVGFPMDKT